MRISLKSILSVQLTRLVPSLLQMRLIHIINININGVNEQQIETESDEFVCDIEAKMKTKRDPPDFHRSLCEEWLGLRWVRTSSE